MTNGIDLYIDKIWKALSFSGTYSSMNTVQKYNFAFPHFTVPERVRASESPDYIEMHEVYTFKVAISIWVKNSQDKQTLL